MATRPPIPCAPYLSSDLRQDMRVPVSVTMCPRLLRWSLRSLQSHSHPGVPHPICPQEVPPSARHPPPHPYWAPQAASHPDPSRGPAQQSFPSSPRTAVQKAWGQQKGIPRQDWLLRALLSPSSTPPASPQCDSPPQQGAPHRSAPSFLICTCILPALPSPIVSWPAEWTLSNSGHQSCRIVTSALRHVQGGRMVAGLLCRQPFSLCTSPSLPARP